MMVPILIMIWEDQMNNNQLGNSTELPPFNPNFGNDTNAPDGIQQFMNNEQRESLEHPKHFF